MERKYEILILAMLAGLGGCATQGPLERMSETFPRGEVITLMVHDQRVPNWMLDTGKLQLDYFIRGDEVSLEQLAAVAKAEGLCRFRTDKAHPNDLVAVLSSGVLYAVAGFAGVGLGSMAFAGTKFLEYATYGAGATGFAGAANGIISLGGKVYTFENCGRDILASLPGYEVRVLNRSP